MTDQIVIPINHIERKPHSKKYRVIGKGVTVEFLSRLIDDPEWPLARICENYGLTPAEVHVAWAFYYDHRHEIEQTLAEDVEKSAPTADDNARREKLAQRYYEKTGKLYPDDAE